MTTIKNYIKRHLKLIYFVLTFAISWGCILILVGPGGIPITTELSEMLVHSSLVVTTMIPVPMTLSRRSLLTWLLVWGAVLWIVVAAGVIVNGGKLERGSVVRTS